MQKIAITGNLAAGKSLVGEFLRELNFPVLDADEVVSKLYQTAEVKDLLQDKFGFYAFHQDGEVNKKWLRELIFNDQLYRKWLEKILWPRVWSEVEMWLFAQKKKQQAKAFVLVPLLFEAGWEKRFDKIWLVSGREEDVLQRLQIRDHIDLVTAKKRLLLQTPESQKRGLVDLIINNRGTIDELKAQITSLSKN